MSAGDESGTAVLPIGTPITIFECNHNDVRCPATSIAVWADTGDVQVRVDNLHLTGEWFPMRVNTVYYFCVAPKGLGDVFAKEANGGANIYWGINCKVVA